MQKLGVLFEKHQAQTTTYPMGIEIIRAKGCYLYDQNNKRYLDLIAGVSACSLGHRHPKVVRAIKKQLRKYLHVMVYGEFVQKEPVLLTKLLADNLPNPLDTTYLTNSGTEAIEGALKLAKRVTGRAEIIAANNAYHGNTMGAMSVMGYEERKSAYRPLIPGTLFIDFNDFDAVDQITTKTAAIILETIQGGAGFIQPEKEYLKRVKKRCEEVGALLILDEIQPGMGRTGKLFAFMDHGIVPDILVTGKGLGGGLPVGAFIAAQHHMAQLKEAPSLGHITTFGGNPVIAAACRATLSTILSRNLMAETLKKEQLFRELLLHKKIKEIRGKGLMLALIMDSPETAQQLVKQSIKNGLLLFFLLFEPKAVRISPPLTISKKQIKHACQKILQVLDGLNC
ncbi:MAG: aminotransferase class III-fold pyridoxal phosphate-dependent enzyme [Bacteroidetes bacterium]|nr:aminotransferase class III-fold pyridoxal phosphate-dependent enzyme [Bacteroidota bacterium]MDA0888607.1 aminotransferase class III-fold pyridoxal phosphate-dependent enzyme [Bacteroidota bacterium]MDA1085023.1 aminotransferase class III-fold pyridoxal phosphate-dependent enzyme [Bacteroidota bacterium]